MDHLRIQISGYPRTRPGIRDDGTMMTGQGAHKIVSAAVEPSPDKPERIATKEPRHKQ